MSAAAPASAGNDHVYPITASKQGIRFALNTAQICSVGVVRVGATPSRSVPAVYVAAPAAAVLAVTDADKGLATLSTEITRQASAS